MIVLLVAEHGTKKAHGVPIKIGVLDKHFAATPRWGRYSGKLLPHAFDVTHIPSGACAAIGECSPERATVMFEKIVKMLGKETYQKAVRKAMKRRRQLEKDHPSWFRK